jgi:uncharacterized phage protein gp47/JayE
MGLKIKSFQSILTGMVDWITTNTTKITDFTVGSGVRTLLEGVASSIEELYFSMYQNIQYAIENAIYNAFGFTQIPAQPSSGTLTLTFYKALSDVAYLPTGTEFATSGANPLYFVTEQDYTIAAGSTSADLIVYCTTAGVAGNVNANAITIMTNPISIVKSVANSLAFTSGEEAESTSARKQRFNKYIQSLARGTVAAIQYGCLEVNGVAGAYVDDSLVGVVNVYCHDSNGNLSDELKAKIIANLENYRAAGIQVNVLPIVKTLVDIAMTVTVTAADNTSAYKTSLETNLTNYLNNFTVSEDLLIFDLSKFVGNLDTTGITNVKVTSPADDVMVATQDLIRPNSITVTLVSAS